MLEAKVDDSLQLIVGEPIPRPAWRRSQEAAARICPADSSASLTFKSLRSFSIAPHFRFAYAATGLLITEEMEDQASPEDLQRWYGALLEYFRREEAGKSRNSSDSHH